MKQVAIFYRDRENQPAIRYIENNLLNVLGDYIQITNYYLDEMPPHQLISADAYLVCYEEMLRFLPNHIDDFSKVIVITRSIQKKYLKPLANIPKGSNVLLVNDSRESTLQTIYMIYELGIGHLNLIPYDPASAASGMYDNIHIAILAHHAADLIPSHIKEIYSIHNREVSFETFQKLIALLDLETPVVKRNLIHKIHDEREVGSNFIDSYFSNYLKDQMIVSVVEESHRAIILLDLNNRVHYINETAYDLFGLGSGDLFDQQMLFGEALIQKKEFTDEVVSYHGVNYLASKESVTLLDELMGYILFLQDEKGLRDTENNLTQQLQRSGFYAKYHFKDIIHCSSSMQNCIAIAKKAAPSDHTVLIRGESGTGKELLAQSIHNFSNQKNQPFVAINCAALPEALLESELFGYEAGSFTGAQKNGKIGLFEHAQHGTIFLDEIGDISPSLQSRLLRVLQERQIMRIGSDKLINIDVRILAATNVNLEKQVLEGKFRNDLFYRLNVISINIAPLRNRPEDILPLLEAFLGKNFHDIAPKDIQAILRHSWPGNVRELENAALYYRLLGELPSSIQQGVHILKGNDGPALQSPSPSLAERPIFSYEALSDIVLDTIAQNSNSASGIGRLALQALLAARGITVGEGTLKKIMADLKNHSYISVSQGRSGSKITKKGLYYLQSL